MIGLHAVRMGGGNFNPNTLPGMIFHLRSVDATATSSASGAAATINMSGSTATLTSATGLASYHSGGTITITAASNPANLGSFTILTAGTNTCTYTNASGVNQVGSVGWSVLGQCNDITDKKNSFLFTSLNTTTNAFSLNTSLVPGKQVLATGNTNLRYLRRLNADCSSNFNGLTPTTFFIYFYPPSFNGTTIAWMQMRDQTPGTTFDDIIQARYVTASAAVQYNRDNGINSSTYPTNNTGTPALVANEWQSYFLVYDGNVTITQYRNGTSQSRTQVTANANVSVSNLVNTLIGSLNNSTTPAGGGPMYLAGVAGANQAWSATEVQNMHNYYASLIA